MINKEILKQIIDDLLEVCNDKKISVSGEGILLQACSYHRGMLAQKNKEKQMMTEKQRKFLKLNEKKLRGLGFNIDDVQSKEDAFKIIKQFMEKHGKNKV